MIARRPMKWAVWGIGAVLALVILVLMVPFLSRVSGKEGRIALPAKTSYTSGRYYAFVNPWGAEDRRVMGPWARKSETMWIDHKRFPDHSRFNWAWPPLAPGNGVGVWGYHHIGYGNYDGGSPEQAVTPLRVKDIKAFKTAFAWDGSFTFGQSTVLTEFYLRTNPQDNESKTLEIGWLLHFSPETRAFIAQSKAVGDYTDPSGKRWKARIYDKYLTFSPADGADLTKGNIDMLHALRWLQGRRRVSGEEWLTGVAIGVEPIKGFGHADIEHWQVELR